MLKIVSTTWPWDHDEFTQEEVVDRAVDMGVDELCIRTPVYITAYNPEWHTELARQANEEGIDISIWPVVAFRFPEQEAQLISEEVERYNAKRIILDAEIKNWTYNIPRFLDALGRQPVPVGLGSYRRAHYHPEMRWQTWLQAKVDGEYQIDFAAHQFYPIGWIRPESWQYQFRLDIDSHEREHAIAGRPGMPWIPWMPSFVGTGYENNPGWTPRVESVETAVEYLKGRLGNRLLGMNWWSLDKDLYRLEDLYDYVKSLPNEQNEPDPDPQPQPDVDIEVIVPEGVNVKVTVE